MECKKAGLKRAEFAVVDGIHDLCLSLSHARGRRYVNGIFWHEGREHIRVRDAHVSWGRSFKAWNNCMLWSPIFSYIVDTLHPHERDTREGSCSSTEELLMDYLQTVEIVAYSRACAGNDVRMGGLLTPIKLEGGYPDQF